MGTWRMTHVGHLSGERPFLGPRGSQERVDANTVERPGNGLRVEVHGLDHARREDSPGRGDGGGDPRDGTNGGGGRRGVGGADRVGVPRGAAHEIGPVV